MDLPEFDFIGGTKVFGKRITKLKSYQPIVIEGIHALNERLTAQLDDAAGYIPARLGALIWILAAGQPSEPAEALDLERDFTLVVRCGDGQIRRLNSGEVSVRIPGPHT